MRQARALKIHSEPGGAGRNLLFGVALAGAYALALFLALMGSAIWERSNDRDAWAVFGFALVLLAVLALFLCAGMITRPRWVRWLSAVLLLSCPSLLFSGALTWLINSI